MHSHQIQACTVANHATDMACVLKDLVTCSIQHPYCVILVGWMRLIVACCGPISAAPLPADSIISAVVQYADPLDVSSKGPVRLPPSLAGKSEVLSCTEISIAIVKAVTAFLTSELRDCHFSVPIYSNRRLFCFGGA